MLREIGVLKKIEALKALCDFFLQQIFMGTRRTERF
jgi:hypothetical protein